MYCLNSIRFLLQNFQSKLDTKKLNHHLRHCLRCVISGEYDKGSAEGDIKERKINKNH